MAGSAFSQNWFRVAGLRPRLRAHARIHRQRFRGADWYVVQDDQTGRFHRISPAANHMLGLMTGRRTVDEIWRATVAWLGDEAAPPTQDEVIRLLSQLHAADLLAGDVPPDLDALARRAGEGARREVVARLRNPLALRLPLLDPDRFLDATLPLVRPMFTVWGLLLWLAVVGTGAALAAIHWAPLTETVVDRVLLAENLLIAALVYPVIKAIHELGHGYAAKVWGGAVNEMGLMILVLIPVPYVDASSASAIPSKWRRAVVGGAGILVELFIAGLAMIVWVSVEPGVVRAAAFNAALIAGVSTLLFNGNPLLRFDGYYVLADLVEIPNLGARANRHVLHLIRRYAFGLEESRSPATAAGERTWFTLYAVAAFLYRLAVMVGIALFVAGQLFFVGVLLALYTVGATLVWPVLKGLWWLWSAPELGRRRSRAMAVSAGAAGLLGAGLFAVPLPHATTAEGVVWLPEDAVIRAEAAGVLVSLDAPAGGMVEAGTPLATLEDPVAAARRRVLTAQREELRLTLARETLIDRPREAILREQIAQADRAIALLDARLAALTVESPRAGVFVTVRPDDLPGRYVQRGDLLGYVVAPGDAVVRAVVAQEDVALVRERTRGAAVALAHASDRPLQATLIREAPKATTDLPSAALGAGGGGAVPVDPMRPGGAAALEGVFEIDVSAPIPAPVRVGERALVRLDHGAATLAERLLRAGRQLLLRQFDV